MSTTNLVIQVDGKGDHFQNHEPTSKPFPHISKESNTASFAQVENPIVSPELESYVRNKEEDQKELPKELILIF